MNIELQFVSGPDLSSKLIEWFGGGPAYSHVDCVLPDGSLLGARSDSVGGKPPGVQIRPAAYETWVSRLVLSMVVSDTQADAFYDFIRAQVGKPYDDVAIVGFAVGRDWRETDAWFCSELATAGLETAGILPKLITLDNKVTPGCLVTVVSAIGGVIVA